MTACSREQVFSREAFVFGTRVEIAIYGNDPALAQTAMGAVLREFDRLHRAYHAWEPSDLTQLNDAIERGESREVSPELAAMLRDAQRLSETSDGLFNPALGELIRLWGFHSDEFAPKRPDPAAVAAILKANPRMSDLTLDGQRVSSRNPAVKIDFGGYAKGYALDRAADILRAQGIQNALINIGGNIMALGSKGGKPWRVGIQHPRQPGAIATLPLYDGEAIGTSGDYQRYFELDGTRYAHILDPRTGEPAHGTQSLTVLVTPRAHAGTLSDVASKPAYLAGDNWPAQVRRFNIQHVFRVSADGQAEATRELRARLKFPVPVDVREGGIEGK
ncbi:MAG: FAD:protein FMN transferase [Azoarcus sp.]|nr:FAD:protein FMN transferase [Azoarcus sp.]